VSTEYDEEARVFVLNRGELSIVINFADDEAGLPVLGQPAQLIFATDAGIGLDEENLTLPAHSAAILGPVVD
jgi:maltooligosyltrehalose trehalohydrolase